MLDIHRTDDVPDPKIYFSHSILPSYIDPQNVSTKKRPFSAISKQRYSHAADLLLPADIYTLVKDKLDALAQLQYARVHMSLREILEGDFLNGYIKQGNIMMLSEGRHLVDNRFELYEGTLRMELNHPTYERCGLQGIPVEDGGKKHQKQRWIVEYDLRTSSMKHGGKAFSRLERACRDVLNHSLTWLFYNFNPSSTEALAEGKEIISKHAPRIVEAEARLKILQRQSIPRIFARDIADLHDEDNALGLLEYLHMLSLESPRLQTSDKIDSHLSRYEVPFLKHGLYTSDLVRVRWSGFISPAFMRNLFLVIIHPAFDSKSKTQGTNDVTMAGDSIIEDQGEENRWFALSAQAFGGASNYTIMQFGNRETLVWEMES